MSRALPLVLVILAACLLAAWLVVLRADAPTEPAQQAAPTPATLTESARLAVEAYVRANISQLSPQPEVLGGTFYVTDITIREDGTGAVSYEDGHIALAADFTYSIDSLGQPHIDSFSVIE